MFDINNCSPMGNFSGNQYSTILMISIISGIPFRTFPADCDDPSSFGLIIDSKDHERQFNQLYFAIKDYQRDVLQQQYHLDLKEIYDSTKSWKLGLMNCKTLYPEHNIPNVLPLDWLSIIDYAEELKKNESINYRINKKARTIPILEPDNDDHYSVLFSDMPFNYVDLWIIASQLSGYDVSFSSKKRDDGFYLFDLKGSDNDSLNKKAFYFVIAEITSYCYKLNSTFGFDSQTFSLEDFSQKVHNGLIDEPLDIDWKSIVTRSQDIVFSHYQASSNYSNREDDYER